jgi:hypothetical protein
MTAVSSRRQAALLWLCGTLALACQSEGRGPRLLPAADAAGAAADAATRPADAAAPNSAEGAPADGAAPTPADAAPPDAAAAPDVLAADAPGPADAAAADAAPADAPAPAPDGAPDAPAVDSAPDGPPPDLAPDGPPCVPTGPEGCFNHLDDDCNGVADCADPACAPAGQCLPAAAVGSPGITVPAAEACPAGFEGPGITLGSEVVAAPCTGCTCGSAPVTCSATIWAWGREDTALCKADPKGPSGGTPVTIASDRICDTVFASMREDLGTVAGFLLGPLGLHYGTCMPRGQPTRPAPVFKAPLRFCPASARGTGCPSGLLCLPRPGAALRPCTLFPGSATCPAGTVRTGGDLYEGLEDQRTCGPCTCGSPGGGSCAGVVAKIGSDTDCQRDDAIILQPGEKVCLEGSRRIYAPAVALWNEPTRGTCTPESVTSGAVKPVGLRTLCCAP